MCHPPFKISLNGTKVPLGAIDIAARLVTRRLVKLGRSKVKIGNGPETEGSARDYRGSDLPDLGRFAEAILLRRRLVELGLKAKGNEQ
jgi:hypothetical protein